MGQREDEGCNTGVLLLTNNLAMGFACQPDFLGGGSGSRRITGRAQPEPAVFLTSLRPPAQLERVEPGG